MFLPPQCLVGAFVGWGLNSGLHICIASILLTELSPLLLDFKLLKGSAFRIFTRSSRPPNIHSSSTAQARPSLGSCKY